jgi:hypothetical protein
MGDFLELENGVTFQEAVLPATTRGGFYRRFREMLKDVL